MTGRTKIGLEVHVELNTETKLFCSCPRKGHERPNTAVCPVCLGHPGAKPFLNRKAVSHAIRACLALSSEIAERLEFSRKSYFYPDLAKNFQITQYEHPLGEGGWLDIGGRRIRLKRIHLEEDPASIAYPSSPKTSPYSLIDYNRSGSPLIEIVTEPWTGEPSEAKAFLRKLMSLLEYIGVFDPETCIIKSDVNVSVEETGWNRVEIKNVSGFREVEKAISYEAMRQRNAVRFGQEIGNETRGWDPVSGTTYLLRKKESEDDYAYIPEPNIPFFPLGEMVSEEKEKMPELPWERAERFVEQYGISRDDANVICSSFRLSEMFESLAEKADPKELAKWVRRDVLKVCHYKKKDISEFPVQRFEKIMSLLLGGKITDTLAKEMIKSIFDRDPSDFSAQSNMETEISEAISKNEKAVSDYLMGNKKALDFLVGQVMKRHPEFDAREVRQRIEKRISGGK